MFSLTETILIIVLCIVALLAVAGYMLVVRLVGMVLDDVIKEVRFIKSSVTVTEQYIFNARRDVADLSRDLNTFFRLYGVLRPVEEEKRRNQDVMATQRGPPGSVDGT